MPTDAVSPRQHHWTVSDPAVLCRVVSVFSGSSRARRCRFLLAGPPAGGWSRDPSALRPGGHKIAVFRLPAWPRESTVVRLEGRGMAEPGRVELVFRGQKVVRDRALVMAIVNR